MPNANKARDATAADIPKDFTRDATVADVRRALANPATPPPPRRKSPRRLKAPKRPR